MNLANDNLTHHVGIYEASPHRRYSLSTTRKFTGADAHEVKRPKSNRVVQVAEDTFEQWAWDRLTSRALVILNAHRHLASWTDDESGEVHEDTWTTIDAQDLMQRLLAVFWTEAGDRIDSEATGYNQKHPNTITQDHMEDMIQRVATHQRDVWNWQALSDRGRKGGKESKRPQEVTAQMILALPLLEHSSPAAQRLIAATLRNKKGDHITVRTVQKRMADVRTGKAVFTWTGETACRSQMPEPQKRPEALFSVEELEQRTSSPSPMDDATFDALLEPAYRSQPSRVSNATPEEEDRPVYRSSYGIIVPGTAELQDYLAHQNWDEAWSAAQDDLQSWLEDQVAA